MRVPVVILNWNGWEDTLECVGSLRNAREVKEIWLADNGSDRDRTPEVAAAAPGIRTFRWDRNYGYAEGYNRALRIASAEGYEGAYLLNNDCVVAPDFLTEVLRVAESDSRFAAVGSRTVYADTKSVQFDGEYHARGDRGLEPERTARVVKHVTGAAMFVRLTAMAAVGYFDARLFCYGEEHEWCLRAQRHGWLCALAPSSLVFHKSEASDRNANATYYRTRNRFGLLDGLSRSSRREYSRRFVYHFALMAQAAYTAGRHAEWRAIAQGLHDAARGRFGQRSKPALLVPEIQLAWHIGVAHLRDKWRQMRGLPPGFEDSELP